MRQRTIELRVNQYEPSGVTPAKREPAEVTGVLTVGSDQSLLENFVPPIFDDTFESVNEVRVNQINVRKGILPTLFLGRRLSGLHDFTEERKVAAVGPIGPGRLRS